MLAGYAFTGVGDIRSEANKVRLQKAVPAAIRSESTQEDASGGRID
jgi:hypothetical protein